MNDEQIPDDSALLPAGEPVPARDTSGEKPVGAPGPRAARFGEGAEGRGARRERQITAPREGFLDRTGKFLRDTRAEMRRVSWPTAVEVKNTTIITLIAVIFFGAYLYGVDELIVLLGRFVAWALSLIGVS